MIRDRETPYRGNESASFVDELQASEDAFGLRITLTSEIAEKARMPMTLIEPEPEYNFTTAKP